MKEIIKRAESLLSPNQFEDFNNAMIYGNELRSILVMTDAYSNALELLKENAINDTCDPVVVSHFKNIHELKESVDKYWKEL